MRMQFYAKRFSLILSAEDEIFLQIIHGTFNLRRFYFIRTLTFARCVISVLVLLIDGC